MKIWCSLIGERVQRPFGSVAPGPLKRFDSRNEMTRDEHELQVEGSGHVLNRRESRVDRRALEVRDLSLAQAELAGELGLTELAAQPGRSEDVGQPEGEITLRKCLTRLWHGQRISFLDDTNPMHHVNVIGPPQTIERVLREGLAAASRRLRDRRDSKFSTVICAPVYSARHGLSTQVPVGVDEGLKHESSIHCDELVSLPKAMLTHFVGRLRPSGLTALDRALVSALGVDVSGVDASA